MKQIGRFQFPETPDEAKTWVRYTERYALSSTALVVATTRIEGAWCAYCKGVPGVDHGAEEYTVLYSGDKLSERIARVIFPGFDEVPYAH